MREPLAGTSLAVKDVIDVAGVVTGAGNPAYASDHEPAAKNAPAVDQLVAAGATVIGKTITGELAYSLAGGQHLLPHTGERGHIRGGSSAGSAAAVAAGCANLRWAPTLAARSACRRAIAGGSSAGP
jgi:amidase